MLDDYILSTESTTDVEHHDQHSEFDQPFHDGFYLEFRLIGLSQEVFLEVFDYVESYRHGQDSQNQAEIGTVAESNEKEVPQSGDDRYESDYERGQAYSVGG
ncbi:hypothetical protein IJM16_04695 [Candidatus Saccharibacteria bacterium]|nr:hypothetical protein [Candidatus Saccharibacteria bacterium]